MTDLHFQVLGTLVPKVPCYVFYAKECQVHYRFDTDHMVFDSFQFDITHKQIQPQHTQRPIDWHRNIY